MLLKVSYKPHRVRQLSDGPYHYTDELWLTLGDEDEDAPSARVSKQIFVSFGSSGLLRYCCITAEVEPDWPEWVERLFGTKVRAITEQLVAAGVAGDTSVELTAAEVDALRPIWDELRDVTEAGTLVGMPFSAEETDEAMRPVVDRAKTDPERFDRLMAAMFGES